MKEDWLKLLMQNPKGFGWSGEGLKPKLYIIFSAAVSNWKDFLFPVPVIR